MQTLGDDVKTLSHSVKATVINKPLEKGADTLWALVRRLHDRVKSLETEVSTLRRDINATRRKVYRDEAPPAQLPSEPEKRQPVVDSILFGGY